VTETENSTDSLVARYIVLRDQKATIKEIADAQMQAVDEKMNAIEAEILDQCKALGADSIRTASGTVTRSIKSRYWTTNWSAMYEVIKEHNAFGLLEQRVHQTNMKQFIEENPNVYPAGLEVKRAFAITVRRK
jgi:hypothetical protein